MKNTNGYEKKIESLIAERDELLAKLAALEAQEPKAYINHKAMMPPTLDWAGTAGTLRSEPLYLAAGAKPESAAPDAWDALGGVRMKLCQTCGNKRCPKANNADLACTGSNEVGQPGSSWEHVKPFSAKENQVEQSCAGYGNHAPGDAPCSVCGFTGRKP